MVIKNAGTLFTVGLVGLSIWNTFIEKVSAQDVTIYVSASRLCVNSGLNVMRGESIQFSSIGEGTYGYEGSPVNATPRTNPDGERYVNGKNIGRKNDPNAFFYGPIGALVARVGISDYFLIGSGNQLIMPQSGVLHLCYNEVAGSGSDNSGGYEVSIYRRSGSVSPQQSESVPQQSESVPQQLDSMKSNFEAFATRYFAQGNRGKATVERFEFDGTNINYNVKLRHYHVTKNDFFEATVYDVTSYLQGSYNPTNNDKPLICVDLPRVVGGDRICQKLQSL